MLQSHDSLICILGILSFRHRGHVLVDGVGTTRDLGPFAHGTLGHVELRAWLLLRLRVLLVGAKQHDLLSFPTRGNGLGVGLQ